MVMTHRRAAPAWFAIALAVAAVGACSDDDGTATATESTTTSSSSRPTTTTTEVDDTVEREVAGAYEAASRAFIDAAAVPDPNFAAFAATHTGPMYEQRRGVLLGLQAEGRVIRYPPNSQYRIEVDEESIELDGDIARFDVCVVDDGETVVASSGEVVAHGLFTVQVRAAMRRVDGTWRLAERLQNAEWEGVAGCAA